MFEKFFDKCKSCLAPILWTRTEKGKMMPVDAEPATGGNIQLMDRGDELPLAQYHTVKAPGIRYHKSHFATCPHAATHRKKAVEDEDYIPSRKREEEDDDSGEAGVSLFPMPDLGSSSVASDPDPAPVESSFESGGGESGGAGAGSSWDDSSSSDSGSSDFSSSDSGSSDSGSSDMAGDSGSSGDSTC